MIGFNTKLQQTQSLSPKMIQSVKILQMATSELENYINELALENPVIDVMDSAKKSESIEQQLWTCSIDEESSYLSQRQNNDDDHAPKDTFYSQDSQHETLRDYLWSQLIAESFSSQEKKMIYFMLDSLDERGYLTESTEDIARYCKAPVFMAKQLLTKLQSLEPAGICAGNLEECLILQLKHRKLLTPELELLIRECLDLVAQNRIPLIKKKLNCSTAQISEYCRLIRSLNPKPGSAFYHHETMKYIIPDITVVKFQNHFDILLNASMGPDIAINSYYQKMSQETDDGEVKDYLTKKLQQACWLQQCISQRNKTLLAVSQEIFQNQQAFFLHGPGHLAPLKLSDVAEAAGIHPSTVSRAIDHKYLQCTWGVYPLRFFFQRSILVPGDTVSEEDKPAFTAADIKEQIRSLINQEDKKKPYSDRILCDLLKEQGISISRRTISKYREQEQIPDASGRKIY